MIAQNSGRNFKKIQSDKRTLQTYKKNSEYNASCKIHLSRFLYIFRKFAGKEIEEEDSLPPIVKLRGFYKQWRKVY